MSMAALEPSASLKEPVSVMLHHEKNEYLLCTLEQPHCRQQPLELEFTEGENITLTTVGGTGVIHLSGYLQPEVEHPYDDELSDGDVSEEEEEEEEIPKHIKKKAKQMAMDKILTVGSPKQKPTIGAALVKEEDLDDEDDEDDEDWDETMDSDDLDNTINTTAAFDELDTTDMEKLLEMESDEEDDSDEDDEDWSQEFTKVKEKAKSKTPVKGDAPPKKAKSETPAKKETPGKKVKTPKQEKATPKEVVSAKKDKKKPEANGQEVTLQQAANTPLPDTPSSGKKKKKNKKK